MPDCMDYVGFDDKSVSSKSSAIKLVTINFHLDTLFAIDRDEGIYVVVTPICRTIGINPERQYQRIQRDAVLSKGAATMIVPPVEGAQQTLCLRLELVNGWLFTIDEIRIKDAETRERLLVYKSECYVALHRHFYARSADRDDSQDAEAPKVRVVTEARHTFGESAAAQLWLKLGLPVVSAMLRAAGSNDLFEFARGGLA